MPVQYIFDAAAGVQKKEGLNAKATELLQQLIKIWKFSELI